MPQFRMLAYESFHYRHAFLILHHLDARPPGFVGIFRTHKSSILPHHHARDLIKRTAPLHIGHGESVVYKVHSRYTAAVSRPAFRRQFISP